MAHNPVRWFEIYVQDMPRAKAFYETVLDVTLQHLPVDGVDMWAFEWTDGPGSAGSLIKAEGCPSGGNSTLVYFASEDCALEAGRAVAAGGQVFRDKFSIGEHGFCALLVDTEGNMFGVHSLQ